MKTLFVATMPGCPACEEAKVHLANYQGVPVVVFDVTATRWPDAITRKAPNATPTYWLVEDGKLLGKKEGWLSVPELVKWVK